MLINPSLQNLFHTFLEKYEKVSLSLAPTSMLVHHDMNIRNILIDEKGNLQGMIDFTDACLGSFYLDLKIRHDSILELSNKIIHFYEELHKNPLDPTIPLMYYEATEFSRLLQMKEEDNFCKNEIIKIEQRILAIQTLKKSLFN